MHGALARLSMLVDRRKSRAVEARVQGAVEARVQGAVEPRVQGTDEAKCDKVGQMSVEPFRSSGKSGGW